MDLLNQIVARAQSNKQRIVLPEAEEERTLCAADRALADGLAEIILIGNPEKVMALAKESATASYFNSVRSFRPASSDKRNPFSLISFVAICCSSSKEYSGIVKAVTRFSRFGCSSSNRSTAACSPVKM